MKYQQPKWSMQYLHENALHKWEDQKIHKKHTKTYTHMKNCNLLRKKCLSIIKFSHNCFQEILIAKIKQIASSAKFTVQ